MKVLGFRKGRNKQTKTDFTVQRGFRRQVKKKKKKTRSPGKKGTQTDIESQARMMNCRTVSEVDWDIYCNKHKFRKPKITIITTDF